MHYILNQIIQNHKSKCLMEKTAFKGNYPVRSKILLENEKILEMYNFEYSGCNNFRYNIKFE